jgi:hypothetical protein
MSIFGFLKKELKIKKIKKNNIYKQNNKSFLTE